MAADRRAPRGGRLRGAEPAATTGTTYDPAGNMTSWNGGSTLAYDRLNRMRRFTSGTEDWVFAHTADDERLVSIRIAGNGKIWTVRGLDNRVLREWRADIGVHSFKDYVWTGRDLLAEIQRTPNGGSWTETTLHAGTDHLSSVRRYTDSNGRAIASHIYLGFPRVSGQLKEFDSFVAGAVGAVGNAERFPGS